MSSSDEKPWRFVTNHTQALLGIARDPNVRMRDLAQTIGVTERAAQRIVADLIAGRPPAVDLAPFRPQRFGGARRLHKEDS